MDEATLMMPAEIGRVVALGASNLTRGFATVVSSAQSAWGTRVEVMAALGHGRSYGARSQLVFRALQESSNPACGGWRLTPECRHELSLPTWVTTSSMAFHLSRLSPGSPRPSVV